MRCQWCPNRVPRRANSRLPRVVSSPRLPFGDKDALVGRDMVERVLGTARPDDFDSIDVIQCAESKMKSRAEVTLVAPATVDFVDLGSIAGNDLDSRADAVTVGSGSLQTNLNPVVVVVRYIADDCGMIIRVEHDDVNSAIVIQIVKCGTSATESR